jgi:cytochrome c oxidase subunit 2
LKIDRVGMWRGECAELCGVGHSTMQIIVQSMTASDFAAWVQQQVSAQHAARSAPTNAS